MSDFFAAQHAMIAMDHVGYVHNRLDRDTEHRTEDSLQEMMVQNGSRYFVLHGDKVLLSQRGTRYNALVCERRAKEVGGLMDRIILLGTDPAERNAPRLAIPLSDDAAAALEDDKEYELWSLRAIGTKGLLPADQLGALAQARSLLHWHETHQFCAQCGAKTAIALAGARRDCPACSAQHFPRTDPVVIMLAIHKAEDGIERCLLGHHTRSETPMYSTLAGFMEQGETLEAAVRREIYEESGIEIKAVRYAGSQPWPFPSSLMLGCYAEAVSSDIYIDEAELSDARWFTKNEVREMISRGTDSDLPHVPHRFSIAAWLIQGWLDEN
ncbi:MAG: NAD(+) diphosphatase [Cohaesibacter sp.]|nr:NAD(+) diphosphatase [Cohaesibacter sp.]